MPVYEYLCVKCGEKFSLLQSMGCGEKDTACPRCGGREVKKLMSSFCCSADQGGGIGPSAGGGFSGGG